MVVAGATDYVDVQFAFTFRHVEVKLDLVVRVSFLAEELSLLDTCCGVPGRLLILELFQRKDVRDDVVLVIYLLGTLLVSRVIRERKNLLIDVEALLLLDEILQIVDGSAGAQICVLEYLLVVVVDYYLRHTETNCLNNQTI